MGTELGEFDNYDDENFDDSFDPDNFEDDNFDPDNATGRHPVRRVKRKSPVASGIKVGSVGTFDIVIKNTGVSAITAELFNAINSISAIANLTTNPLHQPLVPIGGVLPANLFSRVYFDNNGNLVYTTAAGVIEMTISCKQLAYKSLFDSSAVQPFKIEKLRYTVQNDAQFDNDVVVINNSWLGKRDRNSVSPRNFVSPNQFQAKIADIPLKQTIDIQSGLQILINSGEQITLNFYTRTWKLMTI